MIRKYIRKFENIRKFEDQNEKIFMKKKNIKRLC